MGEYYYLRVEVPYAVHRLCKNIAPLTRFIFPSIAISPVTLWLCHANLVPPATRMMEGASR